MECAGGKKLVAGGKTGSGRVNSIAKADSVTGYPLKAHGYDWMVAVWDGLPCGETCQYENDKKSPENKY